MDGSSKNVAEFLAQRRETIEAENEERRQINDAALAWDEQFTQPWNKAWESFESAIESTYSKPADSVTVAALVDPIRRIVELAKGTEFEGYIRFAAEWCQRLYHRDPTGEAFHLGDIGDRAVLTTVLAAALDSPESVEQLASELRVKSPFSGKSCRNEVEWAPNRGELPYVLEELVQDLGIQESYGEREAAQQAKVTGPLISGSKDSYYQRTAISYGEKGRSQAQEISAKPGVERLRLLCDADREAKWGSNWVVEQRAKFCLAEDVSVEQANAFSVDEFVRQITGAIKSQDSGVSESRSMKAGRAFLKRLESDPEEFERFKEKAMLVAEAIESHREEFRLLEGEWEKEHGVALPKTIDDLVSMQMRIQMGAGRTFSDDASGNEMWGIIEGYLKGLKDREVSQNSPEPTSDDGAGDGELPAPDSIEELERKTPKLNRNNGQWVRNKRAAKSEGIETTSLGSYRNKGASNGDKTFGRDKDGRIWRRDGTPGSHPWYLKNSLVTAQKP